MTNSSLAVNTNNIIGLNNGSVYNAIELFLAKKNKNSANTERNYRIYIEKFFMYIYGKDYSELSWEDILDLSKLNYDSVSRYQLYLSETNSGKTVNTKMAGIKSLFRELKRHNQSINIDIFDVERLPEEDKHYGKFTEEEILNLIKFAKTIWYKGLEQSIYFETLYVSAIRKDAVLNMTWDMIFQVYDNEIDKLIWVLNPIDKGNKKANTAIPDKLYEKLVSIKEEYSEKVFNVSYDRIQKTFEEYCKAYNIDRKGRNLTIHSIKHSSVIKVHRQYKDTKLTQQHGHHSHSKTTLDIYADEMVAPSKQASYKFYDDINTSSLKDLSKEELIAIINKCSKGTIEEILSKANMNHI